MTAGVEDVCKRAEEIYLLHERCDFDAKEIYSDSQFRKKLCLQIKT